MIRGRRLGVVAGRGSPDDLVNLVAVHVRLLTKRLRYGDERGRDGGTGGGGLPSRPNLEIACSHCT